jgi:phosphate transport system permease protein
MGADDACRRLLCEKRMGRCALRLDREAAALVRSGCWRASALLLVGAWPAIEKYGLGFLGSSVWDPVTGEFGGLVMIYGTIATSLIALVIACR